MNGQYPGIVMSDMARKRARVVWIVAGAFVAVAGVTMIATSVIAIAHGDTTSTTRARGVDLPNWTLGLIALAFVPLAWWMWRRESGVTVKREGLVNIQPVQGGLYLVGNYGSAKGASLPVADNSPMRIALVKTGSTSYGLIKLYGFRMTSAHGDVLMDVRLMPKALDLSPLMAEFRRRRIAVDLDPALESRHDHGEVPHVAPPAGPAAQAYQAQPTYQAQPQYQRPQYPMQPEQQQPTYQAPPASSTWTPQ
jgi:hypothetical protein